MKKYKVKTRFIHEGSFFVYADDKRQAREYVDKHCGMVMGRGIHSTLHDETVDWDFPMHPEKRIGRIKEMPKVIYKGFPVYCSDKKKRRTNDSRKKNQIVKPEQ